MEEVFRGDHRNAKGTSLRLPITAVRVYPNSEENGASGPVDSLGGNLI